VVTGEHLDENGMLVDFKALKLALEPYVMRYDHSMALNSQDPALLDFQRLYPPDALVIFEDKEPSTEAIAKDLYDFASQVLEGGFETISEGGARYVIAAGRVRLERIRVWETPNSWAEFGG
jgi:6-pyruvoyltetrahydropterin/6-carboxytetrahydropterin synthase